MDKATETRLKEQVLRRVARGLSPRALIRTKPTFFTRPHLPVIEFIHVHKFTFGPLFRVHVGLRVVNDPFPAVGLNGPCSDLAQISPLSGLRYAMQYDEGVASPERCAGEIERFVCEWPSPGLPATATWRD